MKTDHHSAHCSSRIATSLKACGGAGDPEAAAEQQQAQ